jgi:hypothetical protein
MASIATLASLGCALLAIAGIFKVKEPAPTVGAMQALHLPSSMRLVRLMGLIEIVLGVSAALTGSAGVMALVGVAYFLFAIVVVAAMKAKTQIQSCGCFGKTDTPPSWLHLVSNVLFSIVSLVSALKGGKSFPELLANQSMHAIPFLVTFAVCLYLVILGLTVLPSRRSPRFSGVVHRGSRT